MHKTTQFYKWCAGKKTTIGGFSIVYVLKSSADFLRDFNMYIVCTTSEYNTVNNIQPVFN